MNKYNKLKKLDEILFNNYYIIIFVVYFCSVFNSTIRPGVIAAIIMFIFIVNIFPIKINTANLMVIMYFLYSILNLIPYIFTGYDIEIFITKFSNSILPVIFYFLGEKYVNSKYKLYNRLLIAFLFCFIIGLYWYFKLPEYYIRYLDKTIAGFHIISYLNDRRFSSFLGSIGIGSISTISIIISLALFHQKLKYRYILLFLISIFVSIMSMQRASYLLTIFSIISLELVYRKYKNNKYILIIIVLIIFIMTIFIITNENIAIDIIQIRKRFDNIGFNAISERIYQWKKINEIGISLIWGKGIGSMSYNARKYTNLIINDGAFFNIIGEIGIFGFIIFIIAISLSLYQKNFKYSKIVMIEYTTIIVLLLSSVGSNTILYQEIAPIFWMFLGRINSLKKLYNN